MPEPRIIKRYANRKLYDTEHSRYVTLDQISELIRKDDAAPEAGGEDSGDSTDETAMNRRSLASLREWVDHSKNRLDEWQRQVDSKIRTTIDGISQTINPWAGVNKDVRALADRIAEL